MAIVWTKYWQGSDDGTILRGIDLRNIQDDLAVVQTVDDVLSIPGQVQGDILYFDGSTWVRLGAGTAGYFLQTNGAGSNPTWVAPTATDLDVTSQATGDLLYFDGANWVRIPAGVEATDAHNVLGVKVDAPNLVKLGKGWTLGAEGGKDIMKDVFYDSDYYEADRGYFAYVKVTYSGCLLNCEE